MGDTRPSFLFVNPEDCPIAAFCLWKKLCTRDCVCSSSAKFFRLMMQWATHSMHFGRFVSRHAGCRIRERVVSVGQQTVRLDKEVTLLGLEKGIGRVVQARSKAQSCEGGRHNPRVAGGAQM